MPDLDPADRFSTQPPNPPPTQDPRGSRGSPPEQDPRAGEDQYLLVSEKIVGTAMMFIGFLNVLLSISGGYEISTVPFLLYCAGLALWAHATILNQTVRYTVMAAAIVVGLAFFHYGEVLFWHKQVFFWGTIALVMFFMFRSTPQERGGDDDRGRHSHAE